MTVQVDCWNRRSADGRHARSKRNPNQVHQSRHRPWGSRHTGIGSRCSGGSLTAGGSRRGDDGTTAPRHSFARLVIEMGPSAEDRNAAAFAGSSNAEEREGPCSSYGNRLQDVVIKGRRAFARRAASWCATSSCAGSRPAQGRRLRRAMIVGMGRPSTANSGSAEGLKK